MFCKHAWEMLDKTEIESVAEQAHKLNIETVEYRGWGTPFKKTFITILTCRKCGKLKRFKDTV